MVIKTGLLKNFMISLVIPQSAESFTLLSHSELSTATRESPEAKRWQCVVRIPAFSSPNHSNRVFGSSAAVKKKERCSSCSANDRLAHVLRCEPHESPLGWLCTNTDMLILFNTCSYYQLIVLSRGGRRRGSKRNASSPSTVRCHIVAACKGRSRSIFYLVTLPQNSAKVQYWMGCIKNCTEVDHPGHL